MNKILVSDWHINVYFLLCLNEETLWYVKMSPTHYFLLHTDTHRQPPAAVLQLSYQSKKTFEFCWKLISISPFCSVLTVGLWGSEVSPMEDLSDPCTAWDNVRVCYVTREHKLLLSAYSFFLYGENVRAISVLSLKEKNVSRTELEARRKISSSLCPPTVQPLVRSSPGRLRYSSHSPSRYSHSPNRNTDYQHPGGYITSLVRRPNQEM